MWKKIRMCLTTVILGMTFAGGVHGQDMIDVLLNLEKIDKRLDQLEMMQKQDVRRLENEIKQNRSAAVPPEITSTLDSLKKQVSQLQMVASNYPPTNWPAPGSAPVIGESQSAPNNPNEPLAILADLRELTSDIRETLKKNPPTGNQSSVVANPALDFKLYGFVKLEAIYDNAEIVKGDWLLYANRGNLPQAKQEIYTMNARHSRLGAKIGGPAVDKSGRTNALLEMDFSGGFPNSSTAARMPQLSLRHAWAELAFPRWELRMGQDWALISGPFPNSTSFVANAGCGNLWMRMPQIAFTFKQSPMKFAVSLNRPMAGNVKYDNYTNGDLDPVDDGERTGMPWMMSRVWFITKRLTLSASGHYGQERINDLAGHPHIKPSYSLNADGVVKVGPVAFTVRGFYGENLNTFLGGILQGYVSDSSSVKNVVSAGGWGQVLWEISKSWSTTLGAGIDDPKDDRLTNNMRARNELVFANVGYKIQKAIEFVFETEYLKTRYINAPAGDNLRFQFASYFKF